MKSPQARVGSFESIHSDLYCPVLQIQGINLEIGMPRKRKPLPPRHKRLARQGRLQAAKTWLRSYPGKNIARGYRKHFGVDSLCAIRELRLLGFAIDPAYERAVLAASRARNKKPKRQEKFLISEETFYGFAFIAGYTDGGAYGITIEEAESFTNAGLSCSDATPPTSDDDIPF